MEQSIWRWYVAMSFLHKWSVVGFNSSRICNFLFFCHSPVRRVWTVHCVFSDTGLVVCLLQRFSQKLRPHLRCGQKNCPILLSLLLRKGSKGKDARLSQLCWSLSTAAINKITYTMLGRWPLGLIPACWKSERQRSVLQLQAQLGDAHSAPPYN